MRDVVVIGAGFAGLGAAVALAAGGHRVTVLEAAPCVGGKAAAVQAAGARIDLGPTVLTDLGPLRALCAAARTRLHDVVSLVHLDPSFVATFSSGRRLALHRDPAALAAELAALGPHARDDWQRLLECGEKAWRLAAHFYARGDIAGHLDLARFVLSSASAGWAPLRFARYATLARLVAERVRTPELARLLGHCARFLGLDADRAPAVALVIPYLFATAGIAYPTGGLAALACALRDLAATRGAEFETGTSVERLELARGRFVAAIAEGGRRVEARACVAAVDAEVTARWLSPCGCVSVRQPTYAARVAWWVVEAPPPQRVHHGFHFTEEDAHPLYVAVPTVSDPTLAPAGVSVVHALLHGRPGAPADAAFVEAARARLVRASAWPAGRLLAQGAAGGVEPCYGRAIGPGLFGSFRPSQRVAGVANLVRAGGSVFPGPGIANVLRSGLRAATLAAEQVAR